MIEKTKAHELAQKQREISVSEFFSKNRHLLGFDNPRKALLMAVKEAVDNSLDACTEAKILPEIYVELQQIKEDRFKVIVEDNGPGIVKEQIPKIFGKLLYGSKFHRLRQSLTYDQSIIIKNNNKIQIIPIGKFVEDNIGKPLDDYSVPCFDWKNYKYSFKPISNVLKHKRENEIYDVTTLYGKNIKVTGCHSLFTINKNTLDIEEIEARKIKKGSLIVAPKKINLDYKLNYINILDYIDLDYAKKSYWYLYTNKNSIQEIFSKAEVIHKKKNVDKSRKYYRLKQNGRVIDILDGSYRQYVKKGFIPVWIVKFLNLNIEGIIKTYYHGKEYKIQSIWPITSELMKFIGLYVAEGHPDRRQIGFTFSNQERDLIRLVCDTGFMLGVNYTVEERPEKSATRVKIFGGIISYLFKKWCGHGAKNKIVPDFVFTASEVFRQDFLDYLYRGDGTNPKNRNFLGLTTTSKELANQVMYLWLMQGVTATIRKTLQIGITNKPCLFYIVSVYSNDINNSNYYATTKETKSKMYGENIHLLAKILGLKCTSEVLNYFKIFESLDEDNKYSRDDIAKLFDTNKIGYKLRFMLEEGYLNKNGNCYSLTYKTQQLCSKIQKIKQILHSDFILLPVKKIEMLNGGYETVYDISVPDSENFIGGIGGLSCHNSMGQQGIGISAVLLYGQLTTGKGIHVKSKIGPKHPAHYYEIHIDTQKNEPIIKEDKVIEWNKEHGIRLEIELQGTYQKGKQSVDEYVKEIALINPHARITYKTPDKETITYAKGIEELPKEAKEIKPHPHGVELGVLIRMMQGTTSGTVSSFLQNDFCRVSQQVAQEICDNAKLNPRAKPTTIAREEAESLYNVIQNTKIIAPPTDCLSPLGEDALIKGLKKEIDAEFYTAVTRTPSVYRGMPFLIECGISYGGSLPKDESIRVMRFANRVPLLYQQGACATTEAITDTSWKSYGLQQSRDSIPVGPVVVVIHMVSVWVPFTSEAKEAIAHYPEIIKDMKLALQEAGRKMYSYIRKTVHAREQQEKVNLFEKYIPELASSLSELSGEKKQNIEENLHKVLKKGMKDLIVGINEAKETEIKGKNVAFGEKQTTLDEAEQNE